MLRIFLAMLIFPLLMQTASADEADWGAPKWACPSSITIGGKIYEYAGGTAFYDAPENLGQLVPERNNNGIRFRFFKSYNIYMVCRYEGLEYQLILHAKDATFCGNKDKQPFSCWTSPVTKPVKLNDDDDDDDDDD